MDRSDRRKRKNRLSDNTKILIFRWWMAGAVYFFLAFGTSLGKGVSMIDLNFMLSLTISAFTILLFDPVMYAMYDVTKRGVIINDFHYHHTILEGVGMKLIEVGKCTLCVFFTSLFYLYGNMALIHLTGATANTVIIKGEPIMFGILFCVFYQLLGLIPSPIHPPYVIKGTQQETDSFKRLK